MTFPNRLFVYFAISIAFVGMLLFFIFIENISFLGLNTLSNNVIEDWNWNDLVVNIALVAFFGVQHSIMARQKFKNWQAQYLPKSLERANYVLWSGIALIVMVSFWQDFGGMLWNTETLFGVWTLRIIGLFGFIMAAYSATIVDAKDLLGLRQHTPSNPPQLVIRSLYRYVRHPIYLGVLIGIWAVPNCTWSRLVFNTIFTIYIYIGTVMEERTLVRTFGKEYRNYQNKVGMLLPKIALK